MKTPTIQVTSIKKVGKTYAITLRFGSRERIISNIASYAHLRVGQELYEGDEVITLPPEGESLLVEERLSPSN